MVSVTHSLKWTIAKIFCLTKGKEINMSTKEIKQATVNEYRWLKRLALASENYFLAEYYENLIKEIES